MGGETKDPAKEQFVRETAERLNRRETVGWGYIMAGAMLIVAFGAVTLYSSSALFGASVLHATKSSAKPQYTEAITKVRSLVGLYDTGVWNAVENPEGKGTVVVMSENFLWLVTEENEIYSINGLAKSVTPDLPQTQNLLPSDVFSVLNRE